MAQHLIRKLAAFTGSGFVLAVLLGLYARFVEPKWLQVTNLNLSTGADPLTIAFVTDIHIGPHFSADDLAPTIRTLERLQPDIILFGGDFISESPRYLRHLEPVLQRMTATARIGCWGIWGNHDLANIRGKIEPVLQRCGITMLCNEAAHLRDDLWVVGIDDMLLGKSDLPAAFAGVPGNARTIALWHEPDLAERVASWSPLMMLSGHTHGGQVRLPILGALATPVLGKRFVAGQFDVHGMMLYVCRGIGMYRPPVRFHCRPELLVLIID